MTKRHIALDTETTGLTPGVDRIIEIAAIDFDPKTGDPTGNKFHCFINPERDIPPEVSKVHGKTWDDLKGEPLFKDIAKSFIDFVTSGEVVIHNARFDVGHLDAELSAAGMAKMEKIVSSITDTLVISRRHTKAKIHTLDALCDRYEVDRTKRVLHGAFVDCEMLAAVYPRLMEDANRLIEQINAVLPFPMNDTLPATMEELAERSLVLANIIKVLEKERERYTEPVKKMTAGQDFQNDLFEVQYSTSTTTDWKKITQDHLQGVNLAPYQKPSSKMNIRYV